MKKYYIFFTFFTSLFLFSQVGIKTQTPRDQLDVRGKLLIDGYVILNNTVDASGNYFLLVRSNDSNPVGEVKKLDVDIRDVGPVNKYNVVISNVNQATVLNLNTNLDVSKYYLGLAEAYFDTKIARVSMQGTNPVQGTYKTAVGRYSGKDTRSVGYEGSGT